ncbi:hypothetical protein [Dactylosporangium sp. NPDC050588]|uniref:hypothetical protein n=1 Tax=Dactylosporangium sp. NPDC050588 TaxID=3157211 RepID=UPI0033DBD4B4
MTDFHDFRDFQISGFQPGDPGIHDTHAESDAFHYSPTVQEYDRNGDGVVDLVSADTDHDGVDDAWQYDTDGDRVIDTVGYDINGDGAIDKWDYDHNADGLIDEVRIDGDQDNRPQLIVEDDDYDGKFDLETWDLAEREEEGPWDPLGPHDGDTAPAMPHWGPNAHYGNA